RRPALSGRWTLPRQRGHRWPAAPRCPRQRLTATKGRRSAGPGQPASKAPEGADPPAAFSAGAKPYRLPGIRLLTHRSAGRSGTPRSPRSALVARLVWGVAWRTVFGGFFWRYE